MELEELRQLLETKQSEVRTLLNTNKINEAESKMQEVKDLKTKIKLTEELELDEKRDLEKQKVENRKEDLKMEKTNEMRSLVKKIMGRELTQEERSVIKESDNAPLFPKQFINDLEKIKKGYGALKSYCHVIPVTKMEGTKPVIDLNQNTLSEIGEGVDIIQGSLKSTDINYKCAKVGLMDILSAESVDDAVVDIEYLAKENFTEIATVNENTKILKIVKANATDSKKATTYLDLQKQMDAFPPAVKNGLVTITNSNGYSYLKNLTDANGRPLNLVTEKDGKFYFNGYELVEADSTLLAPTDPIKNIFITCNMKEAIKFFDRKAITIEKWRNPGNDTQNISILERFDVQTGGTTRSIVKFEF